MKTRIALRRRKLARKGAVLVLAAGLMVGLVGFLSFTVDVGFIALVKAQMQTAADSAALAASGELTPALAYGANVDVAPPARQAAVQLAALHKTGDVSSAYLDGTRDVRFGRVIWDGDAGNWVKTWGATPYNMVEVTVRRDQGGLDSPQGDRPVPLFFAPVIGHDRATLVTTSTAGMMPGVGFRLSQDATETLPILPIALDLPTWTALLNGAGNDNFRYNAGSGTVTSGSDGVREVNLYPNGTADLPPGNRGTVDIGSPNNSTVDLKRQILHGVNASDLAWFGGELRYDDVPIVLNGDTGISAGIKAELAAIVGQTRAIPIFTEVSGPGNNAMYTIVKFVGIRVLEVNLTGSPSNKRLIVQPAPLVHGNVIPGPVTVEIDSIFTLPKLIQ